MRLLSDYLTKTADQGHDLCSAPCDLRSRQIRGSNQIFFYVSAETEAQSTGRYHTTADLVVEVISPGSAIYDRNTKADTYAVLGVKELWLVDEFEGLIEVRVLKGDSYESHVFDRDDELISTVLPGLSFKVGEVFGD